MPRTPTALVAYNGANAGLGNRVRVTMGGANLAEHTHRHFFYVWPTGKDFGPTFQELWDYDRGHRINRATSRLLAKVFPYTDETLVGLDQRQNSPLWQIRTGSEIELPAGVRPWQEDFRRLVPVPEIAVRVHEIFDQHFRGAPFVGVQIRAHTVAHSKTLQSSPVEWFERRMAELAEQNPGVPFYVSSDVQEIQDRLVAAHPCSYGQLDKGPYNSTQAVREAVVDLYLLASASHIIGPYYSSFVDLAKDLNDNLTITENPVREFPVRPDIRATGLVTDPLRPFVRAVG